MKHIKTTERQYRHWTESDNSSLINNYIDKTNEELGTLLNRNPDTIRKQLNKLKLKRPLKSEIKQIEKKVKKVDFFSNLFAGNKIYKQQKRKDDVIKRKENKLKEEKKWAKKYLEDDKPKAFVPSTKPTKPVMVDSKTVIYVDATLTAEQVEAVKQKFINKTKWK